MRALLFFLLLSQVILAQQYSIRTNINTYRFCGSSLSIIDSTIIMNGFVQINPIAQNNNCFANFDLNGNLISSIILDSADNMFSSPFDRTISKIENNKFISAVAVADSVWFSNVYVFDNNLNIQKKYTYRNPEVGFGDSDFFMKIYRKGPTDYIQSSRKDYSSNEKDFKVYKFDTSGVLMDQRQYGQPNVWNRANSMVPSNNNNFIIGSSKQKPQIVPGNDWSQTWLVEIDTNLNVLREWTDNNDSTYEATTLIPMSDGGVIYSTVKKIEDFGFGDIGWELFIAKLDPSWEFKQWEYTFPLSNQSVLYKFSMANDGNIVGVGRVKQKGDSVNFFNLGGLVIKITPEGTLLWQREYYPITDTLFNESILWDFDFLPEGDIVAGGWSINFRNLPLDSTTVNGWLLRLDSYGCLEPGCEYADALNEVQDEQLLNIYPNPGGPVLNIQTNGNCYDANYTCLVTDMQGRLVQHSFPLKPSAIFQVNASNWLSGMYFVHLIKDGKRVNSFKWVK